MSIEIRDFNAEDYTEVFNLWRSMPGVVLRDADQQSAVAAYLARNPGFSFVAVDGCTIVGAVLCGTDGRRGYLQHLAVHPSHRGRGVGRALAERSLHALAAAGIDKSHLMVVIENQEAIAFWRHLGWKLRSDIHLMSHISSGVATA